MNSAIHLKKPSAIVAMLLVLGVAACGGDDSEGSNDGGAGSTGVGGGDGSASKDGAGGAAGNKDGSAGSSGSGGAAGAAKDGSAGSGGTAGAAGSGGAAGMSDASPDRDAAVISDADSCASLGSFVAPTVPDALKPPTGATLSQRFRADGFQVYTCTPSGDGGADSGVTFSWVVVPDASLYNDSCIKVGTHFGGPTWKSSIDGSSVVGARVASVDVTNAIPALLLKASSNSGEGIFSNVTAIQRLNTTGGVAPSAASCNASTLGQVSSVAYTATYYFYTGGTWPVAEAGSDASDAAVTVPDATTDAASEAATDAGSDAPSDAAVTDAGEGG
jgi:hypothetical protein